MSNAVERMSHEARADRRKKIADLVSGGATTSEACREFGVSWVTVYEACREHGVVAPRRNRKPSGLPRRPSMTYLVLAELLRGRATQAEIASKLGVSKQVVSWTAKEAASAGIEFRVPDGRKESS